MPVLPSSVLCLFKILLTLLPLHPCRVLRGFSPSQVFLSDCVCFCCCTGFFQLFESFQLLLHVCFLQYQKFPRNLEVSHQCVDPFFFPVRPILCGLDLECQGSVVCCASSASVSICLLYSIVCSLSPNDSIAFSRTWSLPCVSAFISACCVPLMASWSAGAPVPLPLLRLKPFAAAFCRSFPVCSLQPLQRALS